MTSAGIAFGDFSQDSDLVNYDSPSLDAEAQSVTSKQSRSAQAGTPSNQGVKTVGWGGPAYSAPVAPAQATPELSFASTDMPSPNTGPLPPVWQTAQAEAGASVPPGMDHTAYASGGQAALMRAFQLVLPSQQARFLLHNIDALGALERGLKRAQCQLDEERLHARQAERVLAEVSTKVQGVADRIQTLESVRLSDMDNRIERASTALEFQVTMDTMKEAMASLAAQRQLPGSCASGISAASGVSGALLANLAWLLGTGAAYTQRALSKADVAAVFLSRKILLSGLPLHGSGMPREAGASVAASPLRPVLGGAAFLAAVEASWQLHERWTGLLPRQLQAATAPATLGLRVLRGAVWAAAVVLAALGLRSSCFTAADLALLTLHRRAPAYNLECMADAAALKRRLAARSSAYFQAKGQSLQHLGKQLEEDGATSASQSKVDDARTETAIIADSICRIAAKARAEGAEPDLEKGEA